MTEPPRTGAYLLRKAPNAPATPVATKAATAKPQCRGTYLAWASNGPTILKEPLKKSVSTRLRDDL